MQERSLGKDAGGSAFFPVFSYMLALMSRSRAWGGGGGGKRVEKQGCREAEARQDNDVMVSGSISFFP